MIIVLSGKARSGKDTAADMLNDIISKTSSKGCESIAYADYLKEIVGTCFGLNQEQLYGNEKESPLKHLPDWTPRRLFQVVGTDMFRRVDPDVWLNVVKRKVLSNHNNLDWVVTDARFENEIDWVLDEDGLHIHVDRVDRDFCSDTAHASETSLPEFKEHENRYIVKNNGTLKELNKTLTDIIQNWRIKNG